MAVVLNNEKRLSLTLGYEEVCCYDMLKVNGKLEYVIFRRGHLTDDWLKCYLWYQSGDILEGTWELYR